jgi:hypothetical protein
MIRVMSGALGTLIRVKNATVFDMELSADAHLATAASDTGLNVWHLQMSEQELGYVFRVSRSAIAHFISCRNRCSAVLLTSLTVPDAAITRVAFVPGHSNSVFCLTERALLLVMSGVRTDIAYAVRLSRLGGAAWS